MTPEFNPDPATNGAVALPLQDGTQADQLAPYLSVTPDPSTKPNDWLFEIGIPAKAPPTIHRVGTLAVPVHGWPSTDGVRSRRSWWPRRAERPDTGQR